MVSSPSVEVVLEQRLALAAVDACFEVIRLAPDYLPIHLRLGEIYERDSRPEEALRGMSESESAARG